MDSNNNTTTTNPPNTTTTNQPPLPTDQQTNFYHPFYPGFTLYEIQRKPQPIRTSGQIIFDPEELLDDITCPVCLEFMEQTTLVMECTHRFCKSCIERCLRQAGKECPKCRIPVPSRRSLRYDPHFDMLLKVLVPSLQEYMHNNANKDRKTIAEDAIRNSTRMVQLFKKQAEMVRSNSNAQNITSSGGLNKKKIQTTRTSFVNNDGEDDDGGGGEQESIQDSDYQRNKRQRHIADSGNKKSHHRHDSNNELSSSPPTSPSGSPSSFMMMAPPPSSSSAGMMMEDADSRIIAPTHVQYFILCKHPDVNSQVYPNEFFSTDNPTSCTMKTLQSLLALRSRISFPLLSLEEANFQLSFSDYYGEHLLSETETLQDVTQRFIEAYENNASVENSISAICPVLHYRMIVFGNNMPSSTQPPTQQTSVQPPSSMQQQQQQQSIIPVIPTVPTIAPTIPSSSTTTTLIGSSPPPPLPPPSSVSVGTTTTTTSTTSSNISSGNTNATGNNNISITDM
jgi:hypothetical protein